MLVETVSSTDLTTIFVRLLDEDVDVWRPVKARQLSQTTYQIAGDPVPEDEVWSFQPGDTVVAERRTDSEDAPLIAVAKAIDFDTPSQPLLRQAS